MKGNKKKVGTSSHDENPAFFLPTIHLFMRHVIFTAVCFAEVVFVLLS